MKLAILPVARELAPARPRSGRKPANEFYLTDRDCRFQDRFALQREQAPSPQAGLREAGIGQLIIVGVATHNSVESTARTAGNLGFDTWVVEDACYTFDKTDYFGKAHSAEAVHAMSLGNLHGEYATVVTTAEILKNG